MEKLVTFFPKNEYYFVRSTLTEITWKNLDYEISIFVHNDNFECINNKITSSK